MSDAIAMQDSRIHERIIYNGDVHEFMVNQWTSLQWALVRIRNYAQAHGKLNRLLIVCHGYAELYEDNAAQLSVETGGFGLELCKEGVDLNNAERFRILRNHVENIVVYACSAATTYSALAGGNGDGKRLMRFLAENSGATVYAPDADQYSVEISGGLYDLGRWHGNLIEFSPDGNSRVVESHPL